MRLVIDYERCMRSGQCAFMQPDLFKLDDEGAPVVLAQEVADDQMDMANDAVELCPALAIALKP